MSVCDRGGDGATPPTFAGAVRGHGEGALRLPECVGRRRVERDKRALWMMLLLYVSGCLCG
jgi:hypothetical protein